LKPADVEGGFANRVMLLPFEGIRRPPERDVPDGADEPPKKLVAELKELLGSILDKPSGQAVNKKEGEIARLSHPIIGRKSILVTETLKTPTLNSAVKSISGRRRIRASSN